MTDSDDILLVKECLEGNPKAFESLVDRYQKPVFNAALRILNGRDDAEEITQTSFVKAFENLSTFDPKYKFFSWLYRIAVNESLNFLSQRRHLDRLTVDIVSQEKTPEEAYDEDQMSLNIQDALMRLKLEYRIVTILKHFHDLSYKDISYILDLPEKTVRSRLFTARERLRTSLLKKGMNK